MLESSINAHLLAAYLQDFKWPLSCWELHSTNSLVRDFPILEVISIKEYVISFQSWRKGYQNYHEMWIYHYYTELHRPFESTSQPKTKKIKQKIK